MHDDRIHPGYPDYVQELERIRYEMAMDGASHDEINAWEAATLESGMPLLSKQTRMERLSFSGLVPITLNDDVEHKVLLMIINDKGVFSTKTLSEKLGIDHSIHEQEIRAIEQFLAPTATVTTANNYTVTATTATTTTWNLNFSGNGYVISYAGAGCSVASEPELKPRQWRGEVHGRVRFK